MTLSITPLQPEDIKEVLADLWGRGEKEAKLFGLETKEDILVYLLSISGQYSYAMKANDKPVAVCGASPHDGVFYTWFIATHRFNEFGKNLTIFLKGFLKKKIAERPDAKLVMLSAVDHPEAERWFNALGFTLEKKEGVFSHYNYRQEKS